MGFWTSLFKGSRSGSTVKVRRSNEDNSRISADKYEHYDDGKHSHRSYNLDTTSGSYREYCGGENAEDRHYNK